LTVSLEWVEEVATRQDAAESEPFDIIEERNRLSGCDVFRNTRHSIPLGAIPWGWRALFEGRWLQNALHLYEQE
jgi:hypothetical protein